MCQQKLPHFNHLQSLSVHEESFLTPTTLIQLCSAWVEIYSIRIPMIPNQTGLVHPHLAIICLTNSLSPLNGHIGSTFNPPLVDVVSYYVGIGKKLPHEHSDFRYCLYLPWLLRHRQWYLVWLWSLLTSESFFTWVVYQFNHRFAIHKEGPNKFILHSYHSDQNLDYCGIFFGCNPLMYALDITSLLIGVYKATYPSIFLVLLWHSSVSTFV